MANEKTYSTFGTIPKWVMVRYAKLWKKYEEKSFSYEDIQKILKLDDNRVISVFLNELKKAHWINMELDKEDMRKRLYTLKSPLSMVDEIAKQNDIKKN